MKIPDITGRKGNVPVHFMLRAGMWQRLLRKGSSMSFVDKTLTCRECSGPFTWTAGEQQFYKTRALINIPARCPKCRTERKTKLGLPSSTMTEVVCAQCNQITTVPFVPRNGNPVYCSACLSAVRAGAEVASIASVTAAAQTEVAQTR